MHSGARFRPTRPITAITMFMTSAEIMRPPEFRPPADHIHTTVIFFTVKGGPRRKGLPLNTPLFTNIQNMQSNKQSTYKKHIIQTDNTKNLSL